MKKNLMILGVILVVIALAIPVFAGGEQEEGEVTLSVWSAFPEIQQFVKWAGEKYTQQHPNVTIDSVLFPQRALDEKVAATLPAGQAGDCIVVQPLSIFAYASAGHLAFVPDDFAGWIKKNYPADAVKFCSMPGTDNIYSIPYINAPIAMFYNKDHFAEAGISGPPKNIDEQMMFAKKLTKYDSTGNPVRVGLDLRLSGGGWGICDKFQAQVMVAHGVEFLKAVGDKWRADIENERMVKAIQYYIDAVHKHKVESFETKSDAEGFGLGVSSMFERESWVVGHLRDKAPEINYGTFLMPKGPGGWGTLSQPNPGIIVPTSSKHQKEAWDFIGYWVNDENTIEGFKQTGWPPGRSNIDYSVIYKETPVYKPFFDSFTTPGYSLVPYDIMPCNKEFRTRFGEEMLVKAFKKAELVDNPEGIAKVVGELSKTINQVLDDFDLLAK